MLRICLLGSLEVTRDGKPLDHLGPQLRCLYEHYLRRQLL